MDRDRYIEKPDGYICCEFCLSSMTVEDILREVGISLETAKEEERW